MTHCGTCGDSLAPGTLCTTCVGTEQAQTGAKTTAPDLDVAGLARELVLNPAAGVNRLLSQTQVQLGAALFGAAFLLEIVSDLVRRPVAWQFNYFAPYNQVSLQAHILAWVGWIVLYGGWVAGLAWAANRTGVKLRWEGILAAFAAALLPEQALDFIWAVLPYPLSSVVASATYITSLIYYLALFQIARTATDGDGNGAAPFRFLVTAGLIPAVASMVWGFIR